MNTYENKKIIKIPLIKLHIPIFLIPIVLLCCISLIIFLFCLIFLNMQPHKSNLLKYVGITWVATGVIFFIVKFHVNFYKIKGYLTILPDYILIEHKNETIKIDKSDINYISLRYSGYKGKHRATRGGTDDDGSGNIFEIGYNYGSSKYHFLLSNKLKLKQIREFMLEYNYKFNIIKRRNKKLIFSNIS